MTDSTDTSKTGTDDTPATPVSEYMPADETQGEGSTVLYMDLEPLEQLADNKSIRIPKNPHFSRKDVVDAFQSAFELIGGVPRLALWANANPDKFFQLYGKLLPSSSSSALGEKNTFEFVHRLERSALDD